VNLRYALGMTVIVTVADATVRGRLASIDRKWLVVTEAVSLAVNREAVPIAGRIFIPLGQLTYVQVVE
jgi:hypothetical protein